MALPIQPVLNGNIPENDRPIFVIVEGHLERVQDALANHHLTVIARSDALSLASLSGCVGLVGQLLRDGPIMLSMRGVALEHAMSINRLDIVGIINAHNGPFVQDV